MGIFDDGTPLDAAILQDLDRRLTETKASIPKIGTTTINNNTVIQEVKQKQIFGGTVPASSVIYGQPSNITVTWPRTDSKPTAVVFTPIFNGSLGNSVSYSVSNLSETGCNLSVFMPTKTGATKASIGFYYIVICS